ncbi:hypothetical protein BT96DRAFT_1024053 [Gymnopus androsaceus JB14]|uniref:Uncharacterized protein n=1 Tax=Gymnopus androsaceus JB14 TaxID=1447944 RepID=A0A6A4H093_9AGAR|nr:hypothetical protein BT96DRAFT_1024053 [Gymnopus androsaceus JB14]
MESQSKLLNFGATDLYLAFLSSFNALLPYHWRTVPATNVTPTGALSCDFVFVVASFSPVYPSTSQKDNAADLHSPHQPPPHNTASFHRLCLLNSHFEPSPDSSLASPTKHLRHYLVRTTDSRHRHPFTRLVCGSPTPTAFRASPGKSSFESLATQVKTIRAVSAMTA